jgi:uncharacterized membrane protein
MLDLQDGGWPGLSHVCGGAIVSEFVLAGYNREDVAAHVLGILRAQSDDQALDLDSTAIVRVGADGRFAITTMVGPGLHRASSGVLWGALFELIFVVPLPGTAYGPNLGGVFGALDRAGLDADFRARVRVMLGRQTSCLAFLAMSGDPEVALQRLSMHPSSVLRVSMSPAQEAELIRELGGIPRGDHYASCS